MSKRKHPNGYIRKAMGTPLLLKAPEVTPQDLADSGFIRLDKNFVNGFDQDQDDDPKKIIKAFGEQGITMLVFYYDVGDQIHAEFSVWYAKSAEFDRIKFDAADIKCDQSLFDWMEGFDAMIRSI